jgi:hypothetical protein
MSLRFQMRFKRVPFSVLYTVFEQRIDCIGCMQCIYCTVLYCTLLYCILMYVLYSIVCILQYLYCMRYVLYTMEPYGIIG